MFILKPKHTLETLAFLEQEPIETVFLRGLIRRLGLALDERQGRYLGTRGADEALSGVLLMSRLVVPCVSSPDVARTFGEEVSRSELPIRNIVGRRETVMHLWEAMANRRPQPRLIRDRQPVYWLREDEFQPVEHVAGLRRASLRDLDLVVTSGAAMMLEEVEEDPLAERPDEYRRFVRDRVLRGDEYVWIDREGLCFKCNVSSRTRDAAQIEGVYTPPARRRQGFALKGMSSLCRRLLREIPCLCLYVNDFNRPAIRLYEQLGFQHSIDFQSLFFPPA